MLLCKKGKLSLYVVFDPIDRGEEALCLGAQSLMGTSKNRSVSESLAKVASVLWFVRGLVGAVSSVSVC